jgi:hypothetical protein
VTSPVDRSSRPAGPGIPAATGERRRGVVGRAEPGWLRTGGRGSAWRSSSRTRRPVGPDEVGRLRENACTPGIFISYRRKDSGLHAHFIYQRLEAQYGRDQVHKDVDSIAPGVDFVREVERLIDASDVVLAVIGPFWATTRDGRERLSDPKDLVRQEVAAALSASREQRAS